MSGPAVIKKLDEAVINRIAAGEVIQRPANALKEMIENSIDAKANNILITVKEGGLKYLQIIDNGTGIRKEDFGIVCERFTTSKLEKFEDLNSINTYGFRGEALASISHVAHLTIQSKTVNSDCAYKASFTDSKLKEPPKPCAGNQGTIITVEDLFYNMTTRRNALKNATEEFNKIYDVVSKYAIHYSTVGFTLKKFGQNNSVKTAPNSKQEDNIRTIFGNDVARELTDIQYEDDTFKFKLKGHITNVNYSAKKGTFLLFINHRLVDNSILKRNVDTVYETYLPKGMKSFVYLSLEVDPKNVDVNVHPTKQEVHFLHEEQIIEKIMAAMDAKLLSSNNSRIFYTQVKLPKVAEKISFADPKSDKNKNPVIYDHNLVRTDSTNQKLDKFLNIDKHNDSDANKSILNMSQSQIEFRESEVELNSIIELRKTIKENCHHSLKEILSEHVFVGCVSTKKALIQNGVKLYLCNTEKIMEEFFRQIVFYNFANFGTITFSKSLPLYELAMLSLNLPEANWSEDDGPKEQLAEGIVSILTEKKDMLKEYFSFEIDNDKNLVAIPLLLENHIPEVAGLPLYILRLATEVNWTKEKTCFIDFAKETGKFYAHTENEGFSENANWKWVVEHVLYPAIKKYFIPPKEFIDNTVVIEIASLPNLYKVFERC